MCISDIICDSCTPLTVNSMREHTIGLRETDTRHCPNTSSKRAWAVEISPLCSLSHYIPPLTSLQPQPQDAFVTIFGKISQDNSKISNFTPYR
jgi:hypothetical protein